MLVLKHLINLIRLHNMSVLVSSKSTRVQHHGIVCASYIYIYSFLDKLILLSPFSSNHHQQELVLPWSTVDCYMQPRHQLATITHYSSMALHVESMTRNSRFKLSKFYHFWVKSIISCFKSC